MMVMGRDGKFWAAATLPNANIAIAARMILRIKCSHHVPPPDGQSFA
jgi:hypothetical protein